MENKEYQKYIIMACMWLNMYGTDILLIII